MIKKLFFNILLRFSPNWVYRNPQKPLSEKTVKAKAKAKLKDQNFIVKVNFFAKIFQGNC